MLEVYLFLHWTSTCRHGKVLIPSHLYPTPSQNWIYRDERKEMMKSEGCSSAPNGWVLQWKAPAFFWLKMVPVRIKNGTWEMSGWPFTLIPEATLSRRHSPAACPPSQRSGAQIPCAGIPSVSCWAASLAQGCLLRSDRAGTRNDADLLYVACEGAQAHGRVGGFWNRVWAFVLPPSFL